MRGEAGGVVVIGDAAWWRDHATAVWVAVDLYICRRAKPPEDRWVVARPSIHGVWSRSAQSWVYEPPREERSDDFVSDTRLRFDEALEIAEREGLA